MFINYPLIEGFAKSGILFNICIWGLHSLLLNIFKLSNNDSKKSH